MISTPVTMPVTFQKINEGITKLVEQKVHFTQFIDEYGRFLRFYSQKDYEIYLDERNLELIGRKS